MVAESFGIYVHFPYCLSKCPYCDFASRAAPQIPHERYADAILRELALRSAEFPSRRATSVFFGGGTPSMWKTAEVARVLEGLRRAYPFAGDCEVTLEANPGASDEASFAALRKAGINRLSIGAQSFQPEVLTRLGRRHTPSEVERAVAKARSAGFDNVSIDLIYGAPGHTVALARDDARRAIDLGTEHLSAYALTLEHLAEEVPMARDRALGRVIVPGDDDQHAMGLAVREELAKSGFVRYEISNFARAGRQARHNLLYWRGGGYLALGVGASGFRKAPDGLRGRRYSNKRAPEIYLEEIERGVLSEKESETIGREELLTERLYTGLRLVEGIDLAALDETYGGNLQSRNSARLPRMQEEGLCTYDGRRLALTEKGLDLHTGIAAALVA